MVGEDHLAALFYRTTSEKNRSHNQVTKRYGIYIEQLKTIDQKLSFRFPLDLIMALTGNITQVLHIKIFRLRFLARCVFIFVVTGSFLRAT